MPPSWRELFIWSYGRCWDFQQWRGRSNFFKSNTDRAYLVMEFLDKRMVVPINILENWRSVWHTVGNELLSYTTYPWMFVPQAFTHKHGKCLSCASAVQETFSHLFLNVNLKIHPTGHVTIAVWSWSEAASSSWCQEMGMGEEEREWGGGWS